MEALSRARCRSWPEAPSVGSRWIFKDFGLGARWSSALLFVGIQQGHYRFLYKYKPDFFIYNYLSYDLSFVLLLSLFSRIYLSVPRCLPVFLCVPFCSLYSYIPYHNLWILLNWFSNYLWFSRFVIPICPDKNK